MNTVTIPDRVVHVPPNEPAEQQVVVQLLHRLPLALHRVPTPAATAPAPASPAQSKATRHAHTSADAARAMQEIVRRMPGRWESPATVAVDATGLTPSAVGSYFLRRIVHFGQKQRSANRWLKWLTVVDVERRIILAQHARHARWSDCATLRPLVAETRQNTPIGRVLADAEFDSESNHTFCRQHRQHRPGQTMRQSQSLWRAAADARAFPRGTVSETRPD